MAVGRPGQALKDHMHGQGYLTTFEAADIALVSFQTIHNWITDGRLRSVEYAGRRWVSRVSLDEVTAPLKEAP